MVLSNDNLGCNALEHLVDVPSLQQRLWFLEQSRHNKHVCTGTGL